MKKFIITGLLIVAVLIAVLSGTMKQDAQDHDNTLNEYYAPNYNSSNSFNTELFIDILKRDGCYQNGENDRNFNADNIRLVVNITPKSITDETNDMAIFLVKDGYNCFLMKDQKIYRYDTFGGCHLQLCLWDYDGNGIKDLVSYQTFGSGLSYLGVSIFDLSTMEEHNVITRDFDTEAFSFEFKNGIIYIDGEKLTYKNGQFYCKSFKKMVSSMRNSYAPPVERFSLRHLRKDV